MSTNSSKLLYASSVFVLLILIPVLCCIGMIILQSTPYGLCFDLISGRIPQAARERFIEKVAKAVKEEDYKWLANITDEEEIEDIIKLQPKMSNNYTVRYSDSSGSLYGYYVHFDNGTVIYFSLWGNWPECPDYDITEQELLDNIWLLSVKDATKHYQ